MSDQNNNDCYEFLTENGEACGKACQEICSEIIKKQQEQEQEQDTINILHYDFFT
jgi:hypothetical protein